MEIIPAIDIINGKCVRLTQGDYQQKKVYHENPVEVAKLFEASGIKRLHLVDLDGAKAKRIINHKVLEAIANQTTLHIDFGGGIKSNEDIRIAFESGAKQVTAGTIAVKDRNLFLEWLTKYGSDRIILGADVKGEYLAVSGWQETSSLLLFDFLKDYVQQGVKEIICTDISKDGLLKGPAIDLYTKILKQFPTLRLIASGGVANEKDVEQLKAMGCYGAIIGKAIYEEKIDLKKIMTGYAS